MQKFLTLTLTHAHGGHPLYVRADAITAVIPPESVLHRKEEVTLSDEADKGDGRIIHETHAYVVILGMSHESNCFAVAEHPEHILAAMGLKTNGTDPHYQGA